MKEEGRIEEEIKASVMRQFGNVRQCAAAVKIKGKMSFLPRGRPKEEKIRQKSSLGSKSKTHKIWNV